MLLAHGGVAAAIVHWHGGDDTSPSSAIVIDLAPGSVLRILDHPQREIGDEKKLLVFQSRIDGTHDTHPTHHCEVRSASDPYHPPLRQQKPKAGGVESATSYIDTGHTNLIIVALFVMAAVKFFLVAAWYMHMRTDQAFFRRVFVIGMVGAGIVYGIVLLVFSSTVLKS